MIPSILHHETWQQALCQFLEEEVLTPDCAEFDKDWKLQGKLGKGGFATAEDCDSDPAYLKEKKFMFEEGLALKTETHEYVSREDIHGDRSDCQVIGMAMQSISLDCQVLRQSFLCKFLEEKFLLEEGVALKTATHT
eukprot:gene7390-516_t